MADFIIVDTDILIDAGRGLTEAINCLKGIEKSSTLAVSVITQMELLIGCRNKAEVKVLDRMMSQLLLIKLTEEISESAVGLLRQYRLSHGLLIPDALIAATALAFDAEFISKNQRDYRFINGLRLLPYP